MSLLTKLGAKALYLGKEVIYSAEKHSPEIMVGAGLICGAAGTVLACKSTLKAHEVLDEIEDDIEAVKTASELADEEKYSESDKKKDLAVAYVKGGVKFAKLYWKPVLLCATGAALICCGHGKLKKRYVGALAMAANWEDKYKALYKTVAEEYSEEAAKRYSAGMRNESIEITEKDKDGKEKTKKVKADVIKNPDCLGPYEFIFGPNDPDWYDNYEYNKQRIEAMERWSNDKLILKKDHILTISEIFSEMGLSHIPQEYYFWGYNLPSDYYTDTASKYIVWDIKEVYKDYGEGPVRSIYVNMDGGNNCQSVWESIPKKGEME